MRVVEHGSFTHFVLQGPEQPIYYLPLLQKSTDTKAMLSLKLGDIFGISLKTETSDKEGLI